MARAGLQLPVPSPQPGTVSAATLTSYVPPACPFSLGAGPPRFLDANRYPRRSKTL